MTYNIVTVTAAVQITHGPLNVTVCEGESATFNCITSGGTTTDPPSWIIDGDFYSSAGLPSRHSYSRGVLTVSNVNASLDNGTTYQCVLVAEQLLSNTATLTVALAGMYGTRL